VRRRSRPGPGHRKLFLADRHGAGAALLRAFFLVGARQEGDTTIVTLVEEVVVVEKRLRAIEEVRITKRQDVEPSVQTVTLRREEAVIERLSAGGTTTDNPE
jgi:hypothetical protein